MANKPFLIVANLAVLLNVSKRRVQQLAKELNLQPRRAGNVQVFTNAQYRKMVLRNTKPGPRNGK